MDFEAACSVYIRFRGVNGYGREKEGGEGRWGGRGERGDRGGEGKYWTALPREMKH